MKSKFDFHEIVKIVSNDPKHKDINGKFGVVRGKCLNEETHEWIYGVSIKEDNELINRIYERYLQHTGKKADLKEFMANESIKVRVDPETGEGYILED